MPRCQRTSGAEHKVVITISIPNLAFLLVTKLGGLKDRQTDTRSVVYSLQQIIGQYNRSRKLLLQWLATPSIGSRHG